MTDKQPEALELAELFEGWAKLRGESESGSRARAARELRRLHARVVELEEINRQLSEQYDTAANCAKELQSQLEAIGAGGVESLRKKGNA